MVHWFYVMTHDSLCTGDGDMTTIDYSRASSVTFSFSMIIVYGLIVKINHTKFCQVLFRIY